MPLHVCLDALLEFYYYIFLTHTKQFIFCISTLNSHKITKMKYFPGTQMLIKYIEYILLGMGYNR